MDNCYFPYKRMVEFSTLGSKCSYLSSKTMRLDYKFVENCSVEFSHLLLERGWRRFGEYFSRPQCDGCSECKNLRIDVNNFIFTKSYKKVYNKNKYTKIIIQKPTATQEHIELYNKYHSFMSDKKGWKFYKMSVKNYYELYVRGYGDFGYEVLYFFEDKLVAVDLIDISKDGISAIYFFYDPDLSKYSLGVYSLLKQIEFAKKLQLSWIYLGYYVKDCDSLNYKSNYKPYQILQNNPTNDENPIWQTIF